MADTRNFMWDNLSGSKAREGSTKRTFTTGEAEGLGNKKVEPTEEPTEEPTDEIEKAQEIGELRGGQ